MALALVRALLLSGGALIFVPPAAAEPTTLPATTQPSETSALRELRHELRLLFAAIQQAEAQADQPLAVLWPSLAGVLDERSVDSFILRERLDLERDRDMPQRRFAYHRPPRQTTDLPDPAGVVLITGQLRSGDLANQSPEVCPLGNNPSRTPDAAQPPPAGGIESRQTWMNHVGWSSGRPSTQPAATQPAQHTRQLGVDLRPALLLVADGRIVRPASPVNLPELLICRGPLPALVQVLSDVRIDDATLPGDLREKLHDIMHIYASKLATADPSASAELHVQLHTALIDALREQDPALAVKAAALLPAALGQWPHLPHLPHLLGDALAWQARDPAGFAEWVATLAPGHLRDVALAARALAEARSNPAATATRLAAMPDPFIRALSYRQLAGIWAELDARAAAQWATQLTGNLRHAALQQVLTRWVQTTDGVATSRDWLLTLDGDLRADTLFAWVGLAASGIGVTADDVLGLPEAIRPQALHLLAKQIDENSSIDPTIVDHLPWTESGQRAAGLLAKSLAKTDWPKAVELISRIDPGLRPTALRGLLESRPADVDAGELAAKMGLAWMADHLPGREPGLVRDAAGLIQPEHAARLLNTTPPATWARRNVIRHLFDTTAIMDVNAALTRALALSESADRDVAIEQLVTMASADQLEVLRSKLSTRERQDRVTAALMRKDPQRAVAKLLPTLDPTSMADPWVGTQVAAALAELPASELVAHIERLPPDSDARYWALAYRGRSLAESESPQAAVAWARTLSNPRDRAVAMSMAVLLPSTPTSILDEVLTELPPGEERYGLTEVTSGSGGRSSPDVTLEARWQLAQRLSDRDHRAHVLMNAAELLDDPVVAETWAASLADDADRSAALAAVAAKNAGVRPQQAVERALRLPPGDARRAAIGLVGSHWAEVAPDAAVDWLSSLPPANDRDGAVKEVVQRLSAIGDIPRAQRLVATMADPYHRRLAERVLAIEYLNRDPVEAKRWLNTISTLPESEKRAVLMTTYHYKDKTP